MNTPLLLLEHILFINLDHRTDRLTQVQNEFSSKLKIDMNKVERMPAIKHDIGAIGCALSHIKCLEIALERKYPYVFICEDDIEFLEPEKFLNAVNEFATAPPENWDVFIVSGNSLPPYKQFSPTCISIINCQTTTGYITHYNYYKTLIENFKEGVWRLMQDTTNQRLFAIDQYWKYLQQRGTWFMIYPPCVVQRVSYSDIEKRTVDYRFLMLDPEKKYMFQQKPKMTFLK